MDGYPDPPDEDTVYDVSQALDAATDTYDTALELIVHSSQSSLSAAEAENFEAAVSLAEDALQLALDAARKKVG
jgi:hypothetical protein